MSRNVRREMIRARERDDPRREWEPVEPPKDYSDPMGDFFEAVELHQARTLHPAVARSTYGIGIPRMTQEQAAEVLLSERVQYGVCPICGEAVLDSASERGMCSECAATRKSQRELESRALRDLKEAVNTPGRSHPFAIR